MLTLGAWFGPMQPSAAQSSPAIRKVGFLIGFLGKWAGSRESQAQEYKHCRARSYQDWR
jgi:hypothetical protein